MQRLQRLPFELAVDAVVDVADAVDVEVGVETEGKPVPATALVEDEIASVRTEAVDGDVVSSVVVGAGEAVVVVVAVPGAVDAVVGLSLSVATSTAADAAATSESNILPQCRQRVRSTSSAIEGFDLLGVILLSLPSALLSLLSVLSAFVSAAAAVVVDGVVDGVVDPVVDDVAVVAVAPVFSSFATARTRSNSSLSSPESFTYE